MSVMGFFIAACAIVSGLAVLGLRNPLYSAFALVVNLLSVAGLYAILDAHFLAVAQVVVYAGAIMVLVLFVLMLLSLKTESAGRVGVVRLGIVALAAFLIFKNVLPALIGSFTLISPSTLSDRAARSVGSVAAVGEQLFTRYILQFEASSLVLLVGVVGSVMLAKRRTVQLSPRTGAPHEG